MPVVHPRRVVVRRIVAAIDEIKPQRIFVDSMSDLFGEFVPDGYIAAVFGVMSKTRRHCFQVLTKRAERLPKFFAYLDALAPAESAE